MNEFAIAGIETGKLNALVKNMMFQMNIEDPAEAVRRVNFGEWVVAQSVRQWREQDGVVYFSVTSDGATGPEWIDRLENKCFCVEDYAKSILRSADFKPTNGVTTEIAVLKGELFSDSDRITEKIRAEAVCRTFTKPNAEVACLIRDKFSDEEIKKMGLLWVIAMHEPIKDSDGNPLLLGARRYGDGHWLSAYYAYPGYGWHRGNGFAFAVSQVSSSQSLGL